MVFQRRGTPLWAQNRSRLTCFLTDIFRFAVAFGLSAAIGLRRFIHLLHDERNSAIAGIEGILFFA